MLRNVSSLAPGFEAGVRLLQGGRRTSTVKSYDQKWLKFENFTAQVQDDVGATRMSTLPASSQTVVAYPPPACGHLVKLARKGFAELQGSSMLQPQQVTTFPAEHMFTIVRYCLRPNASKHHIRVCACLVAQFAFFCRADSGVLLTVINAQVSDTMLSINQSVKNVALNQVTPSSRVSSLTDDPDNCFNKLQFRWKLLRNHRDSDLYWFFEDDSVSLSKNSGIITEWMMLLLIELDIPSPPGVKWTGHSLCRGDVSAVHVIGVSIAVIMAWGLWKSLTSALLYIDVSVRPSSEALFFFGHLLARFTLPQAPRVRQATPTAVSSSIDLSDAFDALLEFDD